MTDPVSYMKQYKYFLPKYLRFLLLTMITGLLPYLGYGQGIPDPRWYFGNSPQWISFLNGAATLESGQIPLGMGGSVVATDFQTGALLFYAGGQKIVNADGSEVALPGNPILPQPVHAVPAPGQQDTYYIFVINAQGALQYHTYNYVSKALSGPTPVATPGGAPTGTMKLIRGASPAGYVYWLIVPQAPANGNTNITLVKIATGAPAPTTLALPDLPPFPLQASALAFSEENGLLAIGGSSSTEAVPLMVYSFDRSNPTGADFQRITVVDTVSLSSQGGDISGLAWQGDFLFAAKEQNAQGANGNLYRFYYGNDTLNPPVKEYIIPGASFAQNLDLKTGPDGRVYHLYRTQAGGAIRVGYIRNATTKAPTFATSAFGSVDFAGEYFSQPAPPPQRDYNFAFDYVNACTEAITYFYPKFEDRAPERVEWRLGGVSGPVFSTQMQAVVQDLFQQPAPETISLTAYFPDGVKSFSEQVIANQGYTLEIEPEMVLCPEESKYAKVKVMQNGQDVTTQMSGNIYWYKPRSVKKLETDPANPILNPEQADSINVVATGIPDKNDPSLLAYPAAGTYFVVVNTPSGCQVSASFQVRVYNYEYSKLNLWYFGDGAELDFTNGQPTPDADYANPMEGADAAPEGVTLVVDPNVDPLFSTNGEKLWVRDYQPAPNGDGTDDVAPNGTDMGGSKGISQNSLFEQVPSDPALQYLFTIGMGTDNKRSLRFSVADLKGNVVTPPELPASDVEQADLNSGADYIKARLLQENVAEKLISVRGDSSKIWVITHGLGTNRFHTYPVTVDGIGTPVISSAGSIYGEPEAKGYLMTSSEGTLLAAAVGKAIEVYRFDKETGKVLPDGSVRLEVNDAPGAVYGVSFSPDDKRLFFTAGTSLYQTSIDSALTTKFLQDSLILVAEDVVPLGAIQLAPNNQLYVARSGTNQLGTISNPDVRITESNKANAYRAEGLQEPLIGTSLLGLPNLRRAAGDAPNEPAVSAMDACIGEDVTVWGSNRYNIDQYIFRLERYTPTGLVLVQQGVQQEADSIVYSGLEAGRYKATLELIGCDIVYPTNKTYYPDAEPLTTDFTVYPLSAANVTNGQEVFLCEDQAVTLQGQATVDGQAVTNPQDYLYTWYDVFGNLIGSTQNIQVSEVGKYTLRVQSLNADCPSTPYTVNVLEQRPEGKLGNDITLCAGETLPDKLTATGVDPTTTTVAWFRSVNTSPFVDLRNGTLEQPITDINPEQPGTYRYMIRVSPSDPTLTCFRSDTLTIKIVSAPTVTLRETNNNCTGTADLIAEVKGSGGPYQYTFFKDGAIYPTNGTSGTITVNASGTYSVEVTEATNGGGSDCSASSSPVVVDVQDAVKSVTIDVEPGCDNTGTGALNQVTANTSYTGTGQITYKWFKLENGTFRERSGLTSATVTVSDGTWRVEVSVADVQCTSGNASAEAVVKSIPSPKQVVESRYTICPDILERSFKTITVTGYDIIGWFNRTTGQSLGTSSTINIYEAGEYELQVEGCVDPAVFTVDLDCTPELFLPNAIRPGSNNGVNREFKILNESMLEHITNFEVLIYNRWGELIWQSDDAKFIWRGEKKGGKVVPMGSYPYLILYKNRYGDDQTLKKIYGSIMIVD